MIGFISFLSSIHFWSYSGDFQRTAVQYKESITNAILKCTVLDEFTIRATQHWSQKPYARSVIAILNSL